MVANKCGTSVLFCLYSFPDTNRPLDEGEYVVRLMPISFQRVSYYHEYPLWSSFAKHALVKVTGDNDYCQGCCFFCDTLLQTARYVRQCGHLFFLSRILEPFISCLSCWVYKEGIIFFVYGGNVVKGFCSHSPCRSSIRKKNPSGPLEFLWPHM